MSKESQISNNEETAKMKIGDLIAYTRKLEVKEALKNGAKELWNFYIDFPSEPLLTKITEWGKWYNSVMDFVDKIAIPYIDSEVLDYLNSDDFKKLLNVVHSNNDIEKLVNENINLSTSITKIRKEMNSKKP